MKAVMSFDLDAVEDNIWLTGVNITKRERERERIIETLSISEKE